LACSLLHAFILTTSASPVFLSTIVSTQCRPSRPITVSAYQCLALLLLCAPGGRSSMDLLPPSLPRLSWLR
jgi:hypothetical protein